MALQVHFKQMTSSPSLENFAQEQINGVIRKYISKAYSGVVTFEVDGLDQVVRCHIHVDESLDIQLDQKDSNMYASLDLLSKKLDHVLSRAKDRRSDHRLTNKEKRTREQLVNDEVSQDLPIVDAADILAAEKTRPWQAVSLNL